MMSDLVTGCFLLAALSMSALWLGYRVSRLSSRRVATGLQIMAGGLMAGYLGFLWNRPVLSHLLPTSNLIILANWLPIWGCFFVGVYSATKGIHRIRRGVVGLTAIVACVYSAVAPLLGTPPSCVAGQTFRDALQFQSTPYTCSAACAVSLLQLHGIDATETELAELCLTRQGTHWMGLYRGLKIKTQGTPWDVVVVPLSVDSLRNNGCSPGVLSVQIDVAGFPEEVDHGFRSDVGHSVLYLGASTSESITVFDPSPDYGVEDWDHRVLNLIRNGVALHLVPRDPASADTISVSRALASAMLNHKLTAGL